MAALWIIAAAAREIASAHMGPLQAETSICQRAHAGLISARASRIRNNGAEVDNTLIPKGFWWAKGQAALEQNWAAGDFSTWIKGEDHWQVFGVEFELGGVLTLLPPEQRGAISAQFSVTGNADWVDANEAIRMIAPSAFRPASHAENMLIEASRLGFVGCKAVEALATQHNFNRWHWEEREWDVPAWFWEHYTGHEASSRNFQQNTARGKGRGPIGAYMQLNGLHFLRADLLRHFKLVKNGQDDALTINGQSATDALANLEKPRLADGKLKAWWEAKRDIREGLTQDELLMLARAAFPDNWVARDRIRELAGSRKRGPKPIGGKASAK